MLTAWVYLIVAGIFEWGWISFAGLTMIASGILLMLAQR